MIVKYKFKRFGFGSFSGFVNDLISKYDMGDIIFYPEGITIVEPQKNHLGDVNNKNTFLYIWNNNLGKIRVVTFELFKREGRLPIIEMTFNLNKKTVSLNKVRGIAMEKVEESLGNFFDIEQINNCVNRWWKYMHPVWWILQITRLPFFLIKEAGFNIGKIESSVFGKIIRWIIGAVVVFGGAILPILDAFGYKDGFVSFVKNIFRL